MISRIVPQGDGIAAYLIKATTPAASGSVARQIIDGNVRPLPSKGDGGATAVSGAWMADIDFVQRAHQPRQPG